MMSRFREPTDGGPADSFYSAGPSAAARRPLLLLPVPECVEHLYGCIAVEAALGVKARLVVGTNFAAEVPEMRPGRAQATIRVRRERPGCQRLSSTLYR